MAWLEIYGKILLNSKHNFVFYMTLKICGPNISNVTRRQDILFFIIHFFGFKFKYQLLPENCKLSEPVVCIIPSSTPSHIYLAPLSQMKKKSTLQHQQLHGWNQNKAKTGCQINKTCTLFANFICSYISMYRNHFKLIGLWL